METTFIKDTFTKKFSILDRIVSKELIKEENDYIIITDNIIDRYTAKRYLGNDTKVDAVFDKISYFGIKFHKFFKFEVIKLFERIIKNRVRYGVKLDKIKEALSILKPEIDNKDIMVKFDRNHLEAVMDFKVLPHQELPLKKYMEFKSIFGYRGMLLHGFVGSGKTSTSLFIMEGLHNEVDKVIIMCPLPTVDRVWRSTIAGEPGARCFKEPSSIYVIKDGKPYNNEKYIVCHFEGLEKLQSILDKISGSRVGIIVDESHYLAEAKSKRTKEALDILDKTKSENILLLSGTPIKSGYRELGTIFKFLDPLFIGNVEDKYYTLYKSPTEWMSNVLKERYNGYTTVVKKDSVETTELHTVNLKIKLPEEEMKQFYLSNIKIRLNQFVNERMQEIKSNMDYWIDTYTSLRDKARNNNPSIDEKEFKLYMSNVEIIKKTSPMQFGYIKDILAYCNQFEKTKLMPYLTSEEAKLFAEAKTIYKYPVLKVQGEALANIIGKARIDCHAMMAEYLQYDKILDATDKKTIIFSNYIEVCDRVMDTVKKGNYEPIGIYGETTKNLTQLVQQFTKNPKTNPLVTTYKSLSTGVPLIVADTIICIDMPFRMYVYEQAIGRAWRLGQDSNVTVFILELDTEEPNINSRNIDIITFFKEEVEKITGVPASIDISSESYIPNDISNESLNNDYNTNDITSLDISTEVAKSPKRRQVEDYILKYIAKIVSGDHNLKLYKDLFNRMTDKEFHEYMVKLKNTQF